MRPKKGKLRSWNSALNGVTTQPIKKLSPPYLRFPKKPAGPVR